MGVGEGVPGVEEEVGAAPVAAVRVERRGEGGRGGERVD